MRAALYARVSSDKQRDQKTIESQLRAMREYAAAMGWRVVGEYMDDGKSAQAGRLGDRRDFARLVADAGAGKFDLVVVFSIDRLTRSTDQTERGAILGAFQRVGVKLAVVGAGVQDLDSFAGDAFVTLQALGAASWLREHRKRIVEGKLTAIARGRKPAGPTPYGYRYDRATGIWSIHPIEAAAVREIYERVAAGESTQVIADDLTLRGVPRHVIVGRAPQWERARVYAIARSPTYRGEWRANKKQKLTIAVTPIVDDRLWHAVQAVFLSRNKLGRRGVSRSRRVYLLQRLAGCELCGGAIQVIAETGAGWTARNTRRPGNPARYACINHRRPPAGGERCPLPYLKVADVDARFWATLAAKLRPDQIERAALGVAGAAADGEAWERDLTTAESRLEQLRKVEAALVARFARGLVSEEVMDGQLATIRRERDLLGHQVASATRARSRAKGLQDRARSVRALAADIGRRLAADDVRARRELVELLFEPGSVVLGPTSISAKGQVSLGAAAGSSSHPGSTLSFRLVG